MAQHYYAIRPSSAPNLSRIEKADTPENACRLAYGRGTTNFQWKDLGTRVSVIQSDNKRIALLQAPEGWVDFKPRQK